jgi:hypothetical protein
MNGKSARRLRRAALGLATALTEAGKDIKQDGYEVRKHSNNFSPSSMVINRQADGTEVSAPTPTPTSYQLLVKKDTLKGIYKTLKAGRP